MSFTYRGTLTTPNYDGDEDLVFELGPNDLPDKAALNRLEAELAKIPTHLTKLTADEVKTGKKTFTGGNKQLVIYTADITKAGTGEDYGGHMFRFPNQSDMAREYLRGLLEGVLANVGFRGRGRRVKRDKGGGRG